MSNYIQKYDIYMSFIFQLNVNIRADNWENHYKAIMDFNLIEGAEIMLENTEYIHKYWDNIVDALTNIFASTVIEIGYNGPEYDYVDDTTEYIIRKTLPSKDFYKFINLLMTIYEIYHDTPLPDKIYSVIKKWLIDNESTVKSSGKIN